MNQFTSISNALQTSEFHWFTLGHLIPFETAWIQPLANNTTTQILVQYQHPPPLHILPTVLTAGASNKRFCELMKEPSKMSLQGSIRCPFYLDSGEDHSQFDIGGICWRSAWDTTKELISRDLLKWWKYWLWKDLSRYLCLD